MVRIIIFLSLGLLNLACVSSGRFDLEVQKNRLLSERLTSLEQENSRLRDDLSEAKRFLPETKAALHECEYKLAELDRVQKAELIREIEGLHKLIPETEKKAYYKGQLDLWQSLRIVGTSNTTGSWFNKGYTYTVELYVGKKQFFHTMVHTDRTESAVKQAFSVVLNFAEVATLFVR